MSVIEVIKAELLALCPDFAATWNDECDGRAYPDGSHTVHGVFSEFSRYIADRLRRGADPVLGEVFDYVESKLKEDTSELELTENASNIDNAVSTCFLENLMNRVPEQIDPRHLVPLLGPKSRQYGLAWDEWCGVKTEGLS